MERLNCIQKSKKNVDVSLKILTKNRVSHKADLDPNIKNHFCLMSVNSRPIRNRTSAHSDLPLPQNNLFDMLFDTQQDHETMLAHSLDVKIVQNNRLLNTFDASRIMQSRIYNTCGASSIIYMSYSNIRDASRIYNLAYFNTRDASSISKREMYIISCISLPLKLRYNNIFDIAKIIKSRISNTLDASRLCEKRYFVMRMYARIIENRFFVSRAIRRAFRKELLGTLDASKLIYSPKYRISDEKGIREDLILDKIQEATNCDIIYLK